MERAMLSEGGWMGTTWGVAAKLRVIWKAINKRRGK